MPEKNLKNFAQTIITAPNNSTTTFIGTVVTSDDFPTTNFFGTVVQVVAGEIIKKEVVLVSTRTGTSFSVTRGQDGTSAQNFTSGGGTVYLIQAVVASHVTEIWDKLDSLDIDIDTAEANPGTAKTTPVDADTMWLWDSAASFIKKKVTWSNIKATLKTYFDTLYHTKNALRTGLTATRLLLTDGSGNEGYLAGGSAGQFLNHAFTFATPTITPGIAILQGTRAINTTTGTQNIAHGLGVIPKYVYITANHSVGTSVPDIIYSHGFSNFTTNRCTYYGKQGNGSGYNPSIGNQSNCIYIRDTNSLGSGAHQTQVANITADATNIVLNRTYSVATSSMTTNINFTILCFA